MVRNEVDRPGDVTSGKGVADRLVRRSGQPMPGTRPLVQGRDDVRLSPGEFTAEHLREEMVIAVPLAVVVKRHEEEVLALEDVNDLCGVGGPGHCVTQRRTEPVENGRPGQELPDVARLATEYLLGQEVDDEPVVASELANEGARGGVIRSRPCPKPAVASSRPTSAAMARRRARKPSKPTISTISPAARSRASGSGGSVRVMSTISAEDGRLSSRKAICSWQLRSLITW